MKAMFEIISMETNISKKSTLDPFQTFKSVKVRNTIRIDEVI